MMKLSLIIFSLIVGYSITYSQDNIDPLKMDPLYFKSPEKAIPLIRDLLISEDWKNLSRYYFLGDSEVKNEDLLDGSFFIMDEQPDVSHPGGFWKYKHPFPPGFRYQSSSLVRDNIYEIRMEIEIEQGNDDVQKGWMSFYMIKSDRGFQILPE